MHAYLYNAIVAYNIIRFFIHMYNCCLWDQINVRICIVYKHSLYMETTLGQLLWNLCLEGKLQDINFNVQG